MNQSTTTSSKIRRITASQLHKAEERKGVRKKSQKTHADAADDFYFCELFQSLLAQKALSTLLGGEKAQQNNTELNSRANSEPTPCHCIFAN
jgi:hypothetical protein